MDHVELGIRPAEDCDWARHVGNPKPRRGVRSWRAALVGVAVMLPLGWAMLLTASASAVAKPTLTIGGVEHCANLNPITGQAGGFDATMGIAYEGLLRWSETEKALEPGLATSWKISRGNKAITFTLRQNARFSDGTPVTAPGLVTWFDAMKASPTLDPGVLGPGPKAEALSKWVFRVTVQIPNPDIALRFANGIQDIASFAAPVSPAAIKAIAANPTSNLLSTHTFGAGPYTIRPSQTTPGQKCTYLPNKFYYDPSHVKWSKVVTQVVTDPNTALAALQTGQIDVLDELALGNLSSTTSYKVITFPDNVNWVELLNHGTVNPALGDVRVRQALNYAIDRKAIASALFSKAGIPSSSMQPFNDGDTPQSRNYYSYDPSKAKALLAAAGYPNGFTLKMMAFNDGGVGVKRDSVAQAVCQYFRAVSVTCDLHIDNVQSYVSHLGTKTFDALSTISGTRDTLLWYSLALNGKGRLSDQHGYHDPAIDRLWLKGLRADPKAAAAIWQEIMLRTVTQAWAVPVASPGLVVVASTHVTGVTYAGQPGFIDLLDWSPSH
jgi:ABC-type transport system substrate-binding protein